MGNNVFHRIIWSVQQLASSSIEWLGLALGADQERREREEDILMMIVLREFYRIVLVLKYPHTL